MRNRVLQNLIAILIVVLVWLPPPLSAASRFPEPEFDSSYTVPSPTHPFVPASETMEYIHIAVLVAALALASYLTLKRRSRKGVFALMLFCIAFFGFYRKGCVCPVGALQNVAWAVFNPGVAVGLSAVCFFVLPLAFALFFGRAFCAAVCPLGGVQDLVACRPVKLPRWLVAALGLGPYLFLAVTLLFAITDAGFAICRADPFVAIFRFGGPWQAVALGACFLIGGVFIARPYCRFFCPYGVLLSWFARLSKWRVSITPDECVQCRLCEDACPFGAIRPPTAGQGQDEPRALGVRRLALLLLALPVLVGLGGWSGGLAGRPLSLGHRTVRLARDVAREDADPKLTPTLASDAFRASGRSVVELNTEAMAIRQRFVVVSRWLGVFLGLVVALKLIRLSIRRQHQDYRPEPGLCLSCGRCFSYCPREQLRHRGGKAIAEAEGCGGGVGV